MTEKSFEAHVLDLKVEGYTILTGQLTATECAVARNELEARYPDRERGSFEWLFNKARVFERFYQLPDLLRLVRHFLGPDALLSAVYGSVVMPGEGGRGLHSDSGITGHNREASMAEADEGRRITSHPIAFNMIFCLSPFTETNGATEFVPGSHRYDYLDVPDSAYNNARTAVAPEGSLVLFDVNTWHGTTKNQTDPAALCGVEPLAPTLDEMRIRNGSRGQVPMCSRGRAKTGRSFSVSRPNRRTRNCGSGTGIKAVRNRSSNTCSGSDVRLGGRRTDPGVAGRLGVKYATDGE